MRSKKVIAEDMNRLAPIRQIEISGVRYYIGHQIGRGAFSRVHLVKDEAGRSLVAKIYSPGSDPVIWKHEAKMLRKFASPWIVPFHIGFEYQNQGYLLMDHAGAPISRYVFSIDGKKIAKHVARYLLAALHLFHSNGYVHNDVNPQNVLAKMSSDHTLGEVRLIDLAFLRAAKDATLRPAPVALWMPPPEYLESSSREITSAIDIYHAALVLMQIALGKALNYEPSEIAANKPALEASLSSNNFINKLSPALSRDPKDRPTAAELRRHLS